MIENEIVNQAVNYIMEHIGENIQVEDIAKYCNYSKFYLNRMFKEATGESIHAFIKRIRMEQSAFRLKVEKNKSITDIAMDYGYSSSNYSSSFRKHHNMSPADFRKTILEKSISENPNWEKYNDRIKSTILLESTYDDPSITDVNECMYDLCVTVDRSCTLENTRVMQGGKFVVFHFQGHIWEIYPIHQSLLGIWFPRSGYEIDSRYGFDIYRSIDKETMYMEIDICIPIR